MRALLIDPHAETVSEVEVGDAATMLATDRHPAASLRVDVLPVVSKRVGTAWHLTAVCQFVAQAQLDHSRHHRYFAFKGLPLLVAGRALVVGVDAAAPHVTARWMRERLYFAPEVADLDRSQYLPRDFRISKAAAFYRWRGVAIHTATPADTTTEET